MESQINSYNVQDKFKNFTAEQIKDHYTKSSCPAAVAMTNITGDFNLGTVIRNANFFGFKEAFYVGGSRHWDRRSAVGTHNYIPLNYYANTDDFVSFLKRGEYVSVALECNVNVEDTNLTVGNLFNFKWPSNPIIIVGEEQSGLSDEILACCNHIVEIPVYGTVRSMNVGTASGIAMAHYRIQYSH